MIWWLDRGNCFFVDAPGAWTGRTDPSVAFQGRRFQYMGGLVIRTGICVAILVMALTASIDAPAQDAVKIDPHNTKYLVFRNRPLVLISASEHYGSVINRPFDYEK